MAAPREPTPHNIIHHTSYIIDPLKLHGIMQKYVLVMIWPDGEEMTLTEPTTRRRKLAQARDKINAKYQDGTRTEIRNAE